MFTWTVLQQKYPRMVFNEMDTIPIEIQLRF